MENLLVLSSASFGLKPVFESFIGAHQTDPFAVILPLHSSLEQLNGRECRPSPRTHEACPNNLEDGEGVERI